MGSLARSMMRAQERKENRVAVTEYRDSERWIELLDFCCHHSGHGEMEYQSTEDQEHMACLPCSKSFDCGELPQALFRELLRRFEFNLWLET